MRAIVTIPPYAPFIQEVTRHPIVSGLRLNTAMKVADSEPLDDLVKRLNEEARNEGKELWIDLKCRQLRVQGYWVPPFTEIKVSHKLHVKTPCKAYFEDGTEVATVVKVDGNSIFTLEGPRRVIGPGESLNILDPTLSIEGYLTDTDKRYVEAGLKAGIKNYMLSYVESLGDIKCLDSYEQGLKLVAKIESLKGIKYIADDWKQDCRLMAARGDLYVELAKPHHMIKALETIIGKDNDAIVASRIFTSLKDSLEPNCADIGDVDSLMRMGYKTFMFGDDICMRRESILSGLNLFMYMADNYEGHK